MLSLEEIGSARILYEERYIRKKLANSFTMARRTLKQGAKSMKAWVLLRREEGER